MTKKADCRRQRKRTVAPVKNDRKPTGRGHAGRFQPGNKVGVRFGAGQPTDHGGRPPGPSLSDSLRRAWERKVKGKLAVDVFAEKVITMALDGEGADALKAGQFAADRAFGPIEQQHQVNVRNGAEIEYVNDWRQA